MYLDRPIPVTHACQPTGVPELRSIQQYSTISCFWKSGSVPPRGSFRCHQRELFPGTIRVTSTVLPAHVPPSATSDDATSSSPTSFSGNHQQRVLASAEQTEKW